MAGRVSGKVALVTGAGSGIGRGTAMVLAREGAKVVVADLNEVSGMDTVAAIDNAGGTAGFISLDVTREQAWQSLAAELEDRFGRLDILVNNAGIGLSSPVVDMSFEDWRRQMSVNVDGVFLGVKYCLPLMRKSGGGSIINVSSIAGIKASPNVSGYCASKGAVRLFTKSVALECAQAKDGVRVNSLHPGVVETPIWDTLIGTSDNEAGANRPRTATLASFTAQSVPLGHPGTPVDMANGILWLASDESRYVTGTELVIDGGRSIA